MTGQPIRSPEQEETLKQIDERIRIRKFQEDDIPFAMELKNIADWNQVEDDWRRYMNLEPDGCFLAEVDGEKAGTGTGITYDKGLGWVGMILVHPSKRRLGVGTALLHETIEYIHRQGADVVKLDATQMGKEVYVPLGFRDEYEVTRYEGTARLSGHQGSTEHVKKINPTDIPRISQFDSRHFGVPRNNVLRRLCEQDGSHAYAVEDDLGEISGYIMAHQGYVAKQIGPWVAADVRAATSLLAALFKEIEGERVFLDVPHPNVEGIELMERYGFGVQRGFCRMYLGDNIYPGRAENIYATSSAEKG